MTGTRLSRTTSAPMNQRCCLNFDCRCAGASWIGSGQTYSSKHTKLKGEDSERISPYTGYTHDIAEMFQCAPSDIKTLRDTYRAIGLMRETHPAYVEKLMTLISEHETFLGITYVSKLRRGVRAVLNGDVSPEQALVTLKRSLASPKQVRPGGDHPDTGDRPFAH